MCSLTLFEGPWSMGMDWTFQILRTGHDKIHARTGQAREPWNNKGHVLTLPGQSHHSRNKEIM